MKKYIFLLSVITILLTISCKKSEEELLIGRWKLSHEISYNLDGSIKKQQDYPYEGNTSVLVFEKDETYRYTAFESQKVTADTGTYNFSEKKYFSQDGKVIGEILDIQKKKLMVDVYKNAIKTHQRTFEKMKD
jgi:hypothetical protein